MFKRMFKYNLNISSDTLVSVTLLSVAHFRLIDPNVSSLNEVHVMELFRQS